MKKSTGIKYNPGDLGGRGRHPSDPTGEFYGDAHWPLPLEHEKGRMMKYMLIDVTTVEGTYLRMIGSGLQVELMGKLLKAQDVKVIAPPLEGRAFAKFDLLQLQYLYWNSCNKPPVSDYGNLVIACLTAFEAMPVSEISIDELKSEVAKLVSSEDETNKTEAKPVKKAAVPRKPNETPAATSTTGKVWVIADRVLASHPAITATTDWKPIRDAVIAACESEGINKATAATQYSKFKASKIAALKS